MVSARAAENTPLVVRVGYRMPEREKQEERRCPSGLAFAEEQRRQYGLY